MTSKGLITKAASNAGVDARAVERDYVLMHIVALISAHDSGNALVFKGGTSLRLLHFEDYRYSADLDYSVVNGDERQARALIEAALAAQRPATIRALELGDGLVSYVGPLGTARTIKLDLAADELVENTEHRPLIKRWSDTPGNAVLAYTKLEITAEKLRCILQRVQCRDFLDLGLLLVEQDLAEAVDLFRRKAAHRGLDATTFAARFEKRVRDYSNRWDSELEQYLGEVPHFSEVERNVRRQLRKD